MHRSPVASLLADEEVMQELQDRRNAADLFARAREIPGGLSSVRSYLEAPLEPVGTSFETASAITEAIILEVGRPSLLIRDGRYEAPALDVWKQRLAPFEAQTVARLASVGRVELVAHPDYEWVGTAWMIDDDLLVTNRHVAQTFAQRGRGGFAFRRNYLGQHIGVRVDFREEYQRSENHEISIAEIVFVTDAGPQYPDVAFLRVQSTDDLPDPIPLAMKDVGVQAAVAVIGYPAFDSRSAGPAMSRIYHDIFDVKRLAPGYVTSNEAGPVLGHDCSTLGGNSGSIVLNLETGEAAGLHFAGRFRVANYAVKASALQQLRAQLGPVRVRGGAARAARESVEAGIRTYENRRGYREDFLSEQPGHRVALPELSATLRADALEIANLRGMSGYALDYTHFSVVMSKSRRLAYYTAVNIDGRQEVVLRRRDTEWKIDPRVPRMLQVGNELYRSNRLDRGHLVRRLDPVWGSDAEARQADDDTFHYTNAAPQHERLNQHTWLALEDYLLRETNSRDLKASVFTGPIFSAQDPVYRDVQIPQEYWKVAVMVHPQGHLHATAYILSQSRFMEDLEFAFGQFRTYQVPLQAVENATSIHFGNLKEFDPMMRLEGIPFSVVMDPADIIL